MITSPKVIAELNRIADQHGGLVRPEQVVEAAAVPESPLHDWFTWDDTAAAAQYRLQQARQLLRVCVQRLAGPDKPLAKVFVSLSSDRSEEGGGYRRTVSVLSDQAMRSQLLQDALDELYRFKRKYAELSELAEVFAAAEKVSEAA